MLSTMNLSTSIFIPAVLALAMAQMAVAQEAAVNEARVDASWRSPLLQRISNSTQTAVSSTSDAITGMIDTGLGFLGIRYRKGGDGPESGGFDCSGLVKKVFGVSMGLSLPRTAAEMAGVGEKVNKQSLQTGDLVFFNTMNRAFSHVGIYLGDNRFLHSPRTGGKVRVERMDTTYWTKRFNGGRRVAPDTEGN